jgi:RepB DNA-primase from phage plasmid/Protein of unknown function (DUF3987)
MPDDNKKSTAGRQRRVSRLNFGRIPGSFLKWWWGQIPGKYFVVGTKVPGSPQGEGWVDKFYTRDQFDEIDKFIKDNSHLELYFSTHGFLKPQRRQNFAAIPNALWADLDGADPREIQPKPTIAWESSPGRYAAMWKLDKPMTKALSQAVTYHVGADKGGWSLTKVLRIPGTRNYKYNDAPIVRLMWDDGPEWTVEQIEAIVGKTIERETKPLPAPVGPKKRAPQWLLKKIKTPHVVGDRSNKSNEVILKLCELNWSIEEIKNLVTQYPDGACAKYIKRGDIDREIESGMARHMANKPNSELTSDAKGRVTNKNGEVVHNPKNTASPQVNTDFVDKILDRGGIIGNIAEWSISASFKPRPILSMMIGFVTVGTLSANNWLTPTGEIINVYVVVIGATGSGKNSLVSHPPILFGKLGYDNWWMSHPKTDVGLFKELEGNYGVKLSCVDEIGEVLVASKSATSMSSFALLSRLIKSLYMRGPRKSDAIVSRDIFNLPDPKFSMIAGTTAGKWYEAIDITQAEDGLLGRITSIKIEGKVANNYDASKNNQPTDEVIADIEMLKNNANDTAKPVGWTKEAKSRWIEYADQCEDLIEDNPTREMFGARAALQVLKFATIMSISEYQPKIGGRPLIKLDMIESCIKLVEYSYMQMTTGLENHVDRSDFTDRVEYVLRAIKKAQFIMHSKLYKAVRNKVGGLRNFDEVIDSLVTSGEIEIEVVTGANHKEAEWYRFKV